MMSVRFLLLLLFPTLLYAQTDHSLLSNWKSHRVPKKFPAPLASDPYYVVFIENDQIKTHKWNQGSKEEGELPFDLRSKNLSNRMMSTWIRFPKTIFAVSDGFLINFRPSEFGFPLYWFSKDGEQNYPVTYGNILQYVSENGKYYALEGPGHMTADGSGSIQLISNLNGKWTSQKYLDLSPYPMAGGFDSKNNLIIATSQSLLSIDSKKNVIILDEFAAWQPSDHKTSLVIKDDVVYIGMQRGIYRFELKTKIANWLLPQ